MQIDRTLFTRLRADRWTPCDPRIDRPLPTVAHPGRERLFLPVARAMGKVVHPLYWRFRPGALFVDPAMTAPRRACYRAFLTALNDTHWWIVRRKHLAQLATEQARRAGEE